MSLLETVEVNDASLGQSARTALAEQLTTIHMRYFSAYPQVMDEVIEDLELPETIAHAWLLRVQGQPVGEFLFHTSLRRRVVQIHYVAMDPDARHVLPLGWLADVTDAALAASQIEAAAYGLDLLAMAGEMYNTPRDFRRWRRKGFLILALDYREPVTGRLWARQPNLEFNRLTLGVRLTPTGLLAPPAEVLDAVLAAFLLDYYALPADNPEVCRMFTEAKRLGLHEISDAVVSAR